MRHCNAASGAKGTQSNYFLTGNRSSLGCIMVYATEQMMAIASVKAQMEIHITNLHSLAADNAMGCDRFQCRPAKFDMRSDKTTCHYGCPRTCNAHRSGS